MANQNASKSKNGFFTWETTRSFLAHLICYSVLLVGSLTAATGGFKGIPFALANIYPLNLMVYPAYVVTTLCGFAVVSGFSNFWSSYQDTLLPYSFAAIDYLHDLSQYFRGKKAFPSFSKPKSTDKKIEHAQQELILVEENNRHNIAHLQSKLNQLQEIYPIHQHSRLSAEVTLCEALHRNKKEDDGPVKKSSFTDHLKFILANTVKALSLIIVAIGSLVVIGMGILTNQSFLEYTGLAVSGLALSMCVIASIFKQACQLSFSAIKQYNVLPRIFQLKPTKEAEEKAKLDNIILKRDHQRIIVKDKIYKIEQELDGIQKDIEKRKQLEQQQSKALSSPILFFKERFKLITQTMADKAALEPGLTAPEPDAELGELKAQEEDSIMAITRLQMRA